LIVFDLWIEVSHGAADPAGNNIDVAVDLSIIRRLEVPCMKPPGDAGNRGQSGQQEERVSDEEGAFASVTAGRDFTARVLNI